MLSMLRDACGSHVGKSHIRAGAIQSALGLTSALSPPCITSFGFISAPSPAPPPEQGIRDGALLYASGRRSSLREPDQQPDRRPGHQRPHGSLRLKCGTGRPSRHRQAEGFVYRRLPAVHKE